MRKGATGVLLFVVASIFSACVILHPGRESAFSVKGKIIGNPPPTNCSLEVYLAKRNETVRERPIPNEFEMTVIVVPGVHKYYMLVKCPGHSPYRTKTYQLGRNYYILNPVDLGTIDLDHIKPDEERGKEAPHQ